MLHIALLLLLVLQVLHYQEGEQYVEHWDYFHDAVNVENGGQRVATALLYLSEVDQGAGRRGMQSHAADCQVLAQHMLEATAEKQDYMHRHRRCQQSDAALCIFRKFSASILDCQQVMPILLKCAAARCTWVLWGSKRPCQQWVMSVRVGSAAIVPDFDVMMPVWLANVAGAAQVARRCSRTVWRSPLRSRRHSSAVGGRCGAYLLALHNMVAAFAVVHSTAACVRLQGLLACGHMAGIACHAATVRAIAVVPMH